MANMKAQLRALQEEYKGKKLDAEFQRRWNAIIDGDAKDTAARLYNQKQAAAKKKSGGSTRKRSRPPRVTSSPDSRVNYQIPGAPDVNDYYAGMTPPPAPRPSGNPIYNENNAHPAPQGYPSPRPGRNPMYYENTNHAPQYEPSEPYYGESLEGDVDTIDVGYQPTYARPAGYEAAYPTEQPWRAMREGAEWFGDNVAYPVSQDPALAYAAAGAAGAAPMALASAARGAGFARDVYDLFRGPMNMPNPPARPLPLGGPTARFASDRVGAGETWATRMDPYRRYHFKEFPPRNPAMEKLVRR